MVNFRFFATGCEEPTNCSVEVADTVLRQGQGMHGSFGRGDTMNFMAAIGPDFKSGYVDALPVSNADVGITAAQLLGLSPKPRGDLIGRVMTEAMPNGATPKVAAATVQSQPAANGLRTVLNFQRVGAQRYFDSRRISRPHGRARGRGRQTKNGGEIARRRLGRDPDRLHQKIRRNLPRFAELVNHLNRQRAPTI